jgi:pimeloyl-ACP methyl ester carboxylesterase
MRGLDLRLADGRLLRFRDSGATQAPTVVFCHGTPTSRLLHKRWLAAAADAGLLGGSTSRGSGGVFTRMWNLERTRQADRICDGWDSVAPEGLGTAAVRAWP